MTSISLGLLVSLIAGGTLAAQAPAAPAAARPMRGAANPAQFFLASTAQLQLTDQQVTRLAAIARRAEARAQAQRATFDSLRSRWSTPARDSTARPARRLEMQNTMRTAMERARAERHGDLRDALAVLTPDQQARAWEMRGSAARGMRSMRGDRGMRGGRVGPGARPRGEVRRRAPGQ